LVKALGREIEHHVTPKEAEKLQKKHELAFARYRHADPADLLAHLDEVGVRTLN
jgi:hypothetical protein